MKNPKILLSEVLQDNSTPYQLISQLITLDAFQDIIYHHVWYNETNKHDSIFWQQCIFVQKSWQLTTLGISFFESNYQTFKIHNDANNLISAKIILGLNDLLCGPWAIRRRTIYTWNLDRYFELKMYDGHVGEFLSFNQK